MMVKKKSLKKKEEIQDLQECLIKKMTEISLKIENLMLASQKFEKIINDLTSKSLMQTNFMLTKFAPLKGWNLGLVTTLSVQSGGYAKTICFAYEKDLIVVGTSTGYLNVYKLHTWEKVSSTKLHNGPVQKIVYLHDGQNVVSGGADGMLVKYNLASNKSLEFKDCPMSKISSIEFCTWTGENIHVASKNSIYVYNINTLSKLESYNPLGDDLIRRTGYIREDKCLVLASNKNRVVVYDITKKQVVSDHEKHSSKICGVSYCKLKGKACVASVGNDNSIKVLSYSERSVNSFSFGTQMSDSPRNIIYCHDTKTVITGFRDGFVTLHRIDNPQNDFTYDNQSYSVSDTKITALGYAKDSKHLMFCDKSGNIFVYSASK